ncbi:hypothetical protein Q7C36_000483 [Tachysurus vachellii]|uniref:Uncharacterized protein n=1 Tax=Tachysurus vachellii TaxID=175792 RepID=A0AA88NW38_TACVA|nr:hypothetical protein Q7C36_000483 [Tachysurus vachellii]
MNLRNENIFQAKLVQQLCRCETPSRFSLKRRELHEFTRFVKLRLHVGYKEQYEDCGELTVSQRTNRLRGMVVSCD